MLSTPIPCPPHPVAGAGRILDRLALKLAFDYFSLHSLYLEVIETNVAVINLHRKMGFTLQGRLNAYLFRENRWLDVVVMGITR